MVGVARRHEKVESLIERPGLVVFRVNRKRPNAGNVRGLQRAKHGVFEEAAAEALALPGVRNRKASQQHDRHGTTGKARGEARGDRGGLERSVSRRRQPKIELLITGFGVRHGDIPFYGISIARTPDNVMTRYSTSSDQPSSTCFTFVMN